jgi:putative transposase
MSTTPYYPTDLTEAQWTLLVALLPERKWRPGGPGRPPCDLRQVLNGILYLLKAGCQWRMVPREFGKWNTIYAYFKAWRQAGVWANLMATLRQLERRRQGRQAEPSAGSVDRQSIKTATQATEVGFDGGKQVKGRKRHLLVDTLGLLIAVVVTAANTDDRVGLMVLLTRYFVSGVKRLRKLWVDAGYQAEWLTQWVSGLKPALSGCSIALISYWPTAERLPHARSWLHSSVWGGVSSAPADVFDTATGAPAAPTAAVAWPTPLES